MTSSVTTTVSSSVTTSTMLTSETASSTNYDEEGEGQEWRRGRTRGKSKPKQPRPTSVCAALAEKERPVVPNEAVDMYDFFFCLIMTTYILMTAFDGKTLFFSLNLGGLLDVYWQKS